VWCEWGSRGEVWCVVRGCIVCGIAEGLGGGV
jgi:hypothetical protein